MLANAVLPPRMPSRRAKALAGIAVLALALHLGLLGGLRSARFGPPQPPLPDALQVRTIVPEAARPAVPAATPATPEPSATAAPPRTARPPPPPTRRTPSPPPAVPVADTQPESPTPVPTAMPGAAQPAGSGDAADAADAAAAWPVAGQGGDSPAPRTLVPASVRIDYTLQRGALRGAGSLDWSARPESYTLTLEAGFGGEMALAQQSSGGFDVDGLAPLRFTDERARRETLAVNFQREAGKISFSGPSIALPLVAGAQDRLSALVQLAAVVAAEPTVRKEGGAVTLFVVGVRADAAPWVFGFVGEETVQTGQGAVQALKFVRAAVGLYDSQVEVWLDPSRQSMPVRWRTANGPDDPGTEWVMERATLAAQP